MSPTRKTKEIWEFGDFQTPNELASLATDILAQLGISPLSVIEPTCGRGAFLLAAMRAFPNAHEFIGVEINQTYLTDFRDTLDALNLNQNNSIQTINADFFNLNWPGTLADLPDPILIIGNPPWITNAELGLLQSSNLPQKSNFQRHTGLDAVTGKSNFDISEWMLLQHLEWIKERRGTIAMLCKSAVARKVLTYIWKNGYPASKACIYKIDAEKYFSASVDACFFVVDVNEWDVNEWDVNEWDVNARDVNGGREFKHCDVYEHLLDATPSHTIGYDHGNVLADIALYNRWKHLSGIDSFYTWRSGIKHDCAKIMELEVDGRGLRNGNGETILLEVDHIYPLFKSSDIGNPRIQQCRKYMLVTQKYVGEDTSHIEQDAPQTWHYLQSNLEAFTKRLSSIYRGRPAFSIFGVGDYTFAPWKVAISGFYKSLRFIVVGPVNGRPPVFDDTVYFLPCWSETEANFIAELLNSIPAHEFFTSMIFWSNKRPITIDLLKRLDLYLLSQSLGRAKEYVDHSSTRLTQSKLTQQFEEPLVQPRLLVP